MLIRGATPEDAPALAEAWHAMLKEAELLLPRVDPEWPGIVAAAFAEGMRQGHGLWFVAEADGRIVATAAAFLAQTPAALALTGRSATIAGVYTQPEYRRRGLARALTERVIEACRERECTTIRLRAAPMAQSLYTSLGFVPGDEMVLKLTDVAKPRAAR